MKIGNFSYEQTFTLIILWKLR